RLNEQDDVAIRKAERWGGLRADFKDDLCLVACTEFARDKVGVVQCTVTVRRCLRGRDDIAIAIEQGSWSCALLDQTNGAILRAVGIIQRRAARQIGMGAVAKWRRGRVFAATEKDLFA